ncbi:MAG TPA: LuxR C-terminal-related transcriptional regulator [Miltoncostaeaceae bacterium]|nr:LuxR C-terminal-related transcriptional regulator [Miltoncostaeaceae bacterium]
MGTLTADRAAADIRAAAREGLDLVAFWDAVTPAVARAVPGCLSPCWFTVDPASLLITSHVNPEMADALPPEALALEYYEDDAHSVASVCRSGGVSTLHEACGGDVSRSPRWHANIELGGDQELLAALRTRGGDAWGTLGLYRERGAPVFGHEERAFLEAVAPALAEGARTALLLGEAREPDSPGAPGLLVLSDRWEVESVTAGAEEVLDDLPGGDREAGRLPPSVLAVAGQARRSAEGRDAPGEVALARVLGRGGRWLVLHGATLSGGGDRRVAVIVEHAHPARIAPLLMRAHGLTAREQDVTRLVLQGASTAEIARDLCVTPHTVQQHLKSVFEKTGVRSRRELVGRVFAAHYEPRLRDNEARTRDGRPLRGGPVAVASPPGRASRPDPP